MQHTLKSPGYSWWVQSSYQQAVECQYGNINELNTSDRNISAKNKKNGNFGELNEVKLYNVCVRHSKCLCYILIAFVLDAYNVYIRNSKYLCKTLKIFVLDI